MGKRAQAIVANDAKLPEESYARAKTSLCLENASRKICRRVELTHTSTSCLFSPN